MKLRARELTDKEKNIVRAMRADGNAVVAIAKRLGCGAPAVSRFLRQEAGTDRLVPVEKWER